MNSYLLADSLTVVGITQHVIFTGGLVVGLDILVFSVCSFIIYKYL